MGNYFMLGLIHALLGYEALVLGVIESKGGTAAEAMLIIAFLCYTVGVILVVLQHVGILGQNFPAKICTIILVFIAALFAIIGVCIWGADDGTISWTQPYSACLDCCGALVAIVSGVFLSLDISQGSSGATRPGNPTA